jgi:S-(hydroxymethyl)glutathione dehydrogenase / alcohol dehydrogenase
MRARAVVLLGESSEPALLDLEVGPPEHGEVLVRIAASGICGSDLHVIAGPSAHKQRPLVLGHEGAGIVEAVGSGVSTVAPGDHVVCALVGPCGTCDSCRLGRFVLCNGGPRLNSLAGRMADGSTRLHLRDGSPVYTMIGIGSLAELAVLRESQVVKIDPSVPLDVASLAGCGVTTGLGAVFNAAHVRPGESVAVVGCGGVGLSVVQGARIAGATTIVGIDPNPMKRELASRLGATHTADPTGKTIAEIASSVVTGGVDVAFEVVGVPTLIAEAFAATRPGGRCVMIGAAEPGETIPIENRALLNERKLLGTRGGSTIPARDIPRIMRLYQDGRLDLDTMISSRRPLTGFADSLADTKAGKVARSVVMMG